MYKTEININGKVIPVKFGAYVIKRLSDDGIKLSELQDKVQDNPVDFIVKIIYYGAINASPERKGEGISINDVYDWIDEQPGGVFGPTVTDVLNLFTAQMTDGVPTDNTESAKKK